MDSKDALPHITLIPLDRTESTLRLSDPKSSRLFEGDWTINHDVVRSVLRMGASGMNGQNFSDLNALKMAINAAFPSNHIDDDPTVVADVRIDQDNPFDQMKLR